MLFRSVINYLENDSIINDSDLELSIALLNSLSKEQIALYRYQLFNSLFSNYVSSMNFDELSEIKKIKLFRILTLLRYQDFIFDKLGLLLNYKSKALMLYEELKDILGDATFIDAYNQYIKSGLYVCTPIYYFIYSAYDNLVTLKDRNHILYLIWWSYIYELCEGDTSPMPYE